MPVYLTDPDPVTTPRTTYVVHIKPRGATVSDPALCGSRWVSYVEADHEDAVPYLITGLETLCVECKDRQFNDYDDPLQPVRLCP